jgi:hypothetical protein
MLIAHTTMLLESCNRVGGPGYVANFVDHTNKPTMMRRFVFDARTISSPTSSVSLRRQCRCRGWQIGGWPPRFRSSTLRSVQIRFRSRAAAKA